jgi:NTP pyrophosphatase (non-canonical NTP hydrolase)
MINSIKKWFETAIPEPTIEQACIQIGCHYEEVGEMAESIDDYSLYGQASGCADDYKYTNIYCMNKVRDLSDSDKSDLLDSLCDQIVTAIGVAHMLGMDIESALSEVNDSNYSKFEDGKPVFNEQGKISKGKYYKLPQLDKFI